MFRHKMNTNYSKNQMFNVELEVEHLAEFMFVKNINNCKLELSLGGVENNKDLFFFLLDLFCKGLVLTFGKGSNTLDLDSLTYDQFNVIKKKMECAGIATHLNVIPVPQEQEQDQEQDEDDAKINFTNLNVQELSMDSDSKPLHEYVFKVKTPTISYSLYFELTHMTAM